MVSQDFEKRYRANARYVDVATAGDEDLGPLKHLPGTWKNTDNFKGRGWNMIALPFISDDGPLDYRLLMNQYNEELKFTLVDKGVPNRGVNRGPQRGDLPDINTDQLVVTLDYEQMIKQIAADDNPASGLAGDANLAIHHEPGLFLHMTNFTTQGLDVARLATVPHGDAALALGKSEIINGPPVIPDISGLPLNAPPDINHPYLAPYKHFFDNAFKGVEAAGFPGFNPVNPNALLQFLPQNVKRTTVLHLDTTLDEAGIRNIPFIVRQANAAEMQSTFWIMEMDTGTDEEPDLLMAYSQFILLDFFENPAGDIIRWPHVSINVMEKTSAPDAQKAQMPAPMS